MKKDIYIILFLGSFLFANAQEAPKKREEGANSTIEQTAETPNDSLADSKEDSVGSHSSRKRKIRSNNEANKNEESSINWYVTIPLIALSGGLGFFVFLLRKDNKEKDLELKKMNEKLTNANYQV